MLSGQTDRAHAKQGLLHRPCCRPSVRCLMYQVLGQLGPRLPTLAVQLSSNWAMGWTKFVIKNDDILGVYFTHSFHWIWIWILSWVNQQWNDWKYTYLLKMQGNFERHNCNVHSICSSQAAYHTITDHGAWVGYTVSGPSVYQVGPWTGWLKPGPDLTRLRPSEPVWAPSVLSKPPQTPSGPRSAMGMVRTGKRFDVCQPAMPNQIHSNFDSALQATDKSLTKHLPLYPSILLDMSTK